MFRCDRLLILGLGFALLVISGCKTCGGGCGLGRPGCGDCGTPTTTRRLIPVPGVSGYPAPPRDTRYSPPMQYNIQPGVPQPMPQADPLYQPPVTSKSERANSILRHDPRSRPTPSYLLDPAKPTTQEPPIASVPSKQPEDDGPQPFDLPGFQVVRDGVATGQKPFADGIVWLSKRKYKTVVHLRDPAEDNTAARRLFEKRGLKYVSIEVTPATITKETYERFAKEVNDGGEGLFVFDKNGAVAGGLWFLYHRRHLKIAEEKARNEAQRLGLQLDDEGDHAVAWRVVVELSKQSEP